MVAKRKTTLRGILRASGIAAVIGLGLSIPLSMNLNREADERLDYVVNDAARSSVRLIAEFTAADPEEYRIQRDIDGNPNAVLFTKVYALPENFRKDFELPNITVAIGVLDNAPFYQDAHRFGPEDQLLVSAYDEPSYAHFSFTGLNYDAFKLHKNEGTLFNQDTIDRILIGVVNTIVDAEKEKEKTYA